ncbi:hypothetical protein [Arcticibacter eurypsychrophilus]|uniref:hypothetical protein n=1 Tax=Arcticibacter eurypsychrophilus TaxID=1434752 RepID=UPI001FE1A1BE|nr:hypothetical protein [Arcticibacter eurypsychrophilus]
MFSIPPKVSALSKLSIMQAMYYFASPKPIRLSARKLLLLCHHVFSTLKHSSRTIIDIGKLNDKGLIHQWLLKQTGYGTTADMEHLQKFWHLNFGKRPDV